MRKDHKVFAMAGLWETYIHPNGSEIDTATIVTTDANGTISALHNRMPVILDEKEFSIWLDAELNPPEKIAHLMVPAADEMLMIDAYDPRRGKMVSEPNAAKKPSRKKDKSDGQASLF
jgi:putative SOS response-associated peptidase YedK